MDDKIDIIVAGVNRKDEKIWGDFYDRFYAALCAYVAKILPVPDAVEDLVQEVFISVWEGKRTFSDIKELTNYLYRACISLEIPKSGRSVNNNILIIQSCKHIEQTSPLYHLIN